MTTKDQERKALEKIRAIVKELGRDSYVGTAFTGVFEIAERNIDNDWGCSVAETIEAAQQEVHQMQDKIRELETDLDYWTSEYKMIDQRRVELTENYQAACKKCGEYNDGWMEEQEKTAALKQEVIELKAKLYDLICK